MDRLKLVEQIQRIAVRNKMLVRSLAMVHQCLEDRREHRILSQVSDRTEEESRQDQRDLTVVGELLLQAEGLLLQALRVAEPVEGLKVMRQILSSTAVLPDSELLPGCTPAPPIHQSVLEDMSALLAAVLEVGQSILPGAHQALSLEATLDQSETMDLQRKLGLLEHLCHRGTDLLAATRKIVAG